MRRSVACRMAVVAVLGLAAYTAHAHGQFPLPLRTYLDGQGGDPLGWVTFGILEPAADGPGYHWICEELVGGNLNTAPVFARTAAGTLLGGARDRFFRFSEDRCAVTPVVRPAMLGVVRSMGTHATLPWVAVGVGTGAVAWSTDDGATFQETPLVEDGALPTGVLVEGTENAPRITVMWRFLSDSSHVLATSGPDGSGMVRVPLTALGAASYVLLQRDGARPGHLYIREDGATRDRLLRVDATTGSIHAVLLEADDDLSLGASSDGRLVATGGLSTPLRVSTDQGNTFSERTSVRQVRAAQWGAQDVLHVAADNWRDGFAFGRSTDLGVTFEPMGRFVDIRGVHTCPSRGEGCSANAAEGSCTPGTGNDVLATCGVYYPALRDLFGIGRDAGVPTETDAGNPADNTPEGTSCGGCHQAALPTWVFLAWLSLRAARRRRSG